MNSMLIPKHLITPTKFDQKDDERKVLLISNSAGGERFRMMYKP
jgi:hypothetical protein